MLSVVVPCCNEGGNIPRFDAELFPSLDKLGCPYEIIAVDDGSTDDTSSAFMQLALRHPGFRVVTHPKNLGLGAALKSGIQWARGDWLVPLDADLSFHPRYISVLLQAQRETQADCVSGSPFLGGWTRRMCQVSWGRRTASYTVNALYRILFWRNLTSYTPMFRLYRTSVLRELPLASDGFEISAEILVRIMKRGLRVVETPVPLTTRTAGASKMRALRELRNHARLILTLLLKI